MINKLRRTGAVFICLLAILCGNVLQPLSVFAISDPLFYTTNDIGWFDDECTEGSGGAGSVLLAGKDNLEKILNFYMQKGLSLAAASGIAGNMMQESGLNPKIIQGGAQAPDDYTPVNGVGFGLVQWTFTARQKPLVDYMKKAGVRITDLGGQLGFTWEELQGSYLSTLNKLRTVDNSERGALDAAVAFHNGYEGSADSGSAVTSVRGGNAQKVFNTYKNSPPLAGAAASPTTSSPSETSTSATADSAAKPDDSTAKSLGKVYILGDSITHGARSLYEQKFKEAGATDVKVNAAGGRNFNGPGTTGDVGTGYDALSKDKAYIKDADSVVIAIGTNQMENIDYNQSEESYIAATQKSIQKAMGYIKDSGTKAKIYWVDVAISSSGPGPYPGFANRIDKAIYASAASEGYSVIAWSKEVDSSYDPANATGPVNDSGHLLTDGIHPNGEGQKKLVDLVVDQVKNGGNAADNKGDGKDCTERSFAGGNFVDTLKAYAWPTYKGMTIDATKDYKAATTRNSAAGRYVGGTAYPGIDCGGFVTQLVHDSGFDVHYNSEGAGGNTSAQEAWAKQHWQYLGTGGSIDPSKLSQGDVAISDSHTFIFVGDVPGFNAKLASASWDERAPMADPQQSMTDSGFRWYHKK